MATDDIVVEILEDGTIKYVTDAVSGPNHSTAEAMLREAARLAGGETTRQARTKTTAARHVQQNKARQ